MIPDGWETIKLGSIANKVTSGARDWAKHYSDSGAKFIRMTNLSRDGIHLNLEKLKYVDIKNSSTDGQRTSLQEGDILISITAELGKIGLVPHNLGQSYINQHTALVRLNCSYVSPIYIAYLLSSRPLNYTINRMNDSGAKSGLNLSTVKAIPISLPPLPEQKKIAQILSSWDKAIETVEKLIANSQQKKKALMQQLLTGKKRFPEFDAEWKEVRLGDMCEPQQWPTISSKDLIKSGYSVYGANGHIGYFHEYNHEGTTITVTCRGSTCGEVSLILGKSYITGNAMCLDNILPKYDKVFVYYALCKRGFRDVISGSAQPQIVGGSIRKVKFSFPSIHEQQKIASVLSSADQEIETWQQELAHLKLEKKALMQQLLTGKRRVKLSKTGDSPC